MVDETATEDTATPPAEMSIAEIEAEIAALKKQLDNLVVRIFGTE